MAEHETLKVKERGSNGRAMGAFGKAAVEEVETWWGEYMGREGIARE